jgi:3-oxoacyl-[acyl-carrier-protein] synthase II
VYVGSSLPSLNCISESIKKAYSNDYTHINRMLMLRMLTNLLASNISIKYDLRGPLLSPTMACATGLNAIGESYNLIKNNDADVMICGGSENSVHPLVFHSMNKLNTLYSSNKNFSATESSRPFDADRSGFIIGEGSGILVIEELSHAIKRKSNIYCEIKGYATFGDAYHMTKPTIDGEGGFRAMAKCLIDANVEPACVNLINAHATSTEIGDISELNALKNLFGNKKFNEFENLKKCFDDYDFNFSLDEQQLDKQKLKNLLINCNKSQIGHLLGAAGSVESIISILSLVENTSLNNINTHNPISELFNLRYDTNSPMKQNLQYVMKNSFAFGGVNTSILYGKI